MVLFLVHLTESYDTMHNQYIVRDVWKSEHFVGKQEKHDFTVWSLPLKLHSQSLDSVNTEKTKFLIVLTSHSSSFVHNLFII